MNTCLFISKVFSIFAQIYTFAMLLQIFGFLELSLTDILDIFLVAVMILAAFRWIKGSVTMSIFIAIVSLYVIRVIVSALDMRMTNALMETVLDVGVIALIIIFQPEIRRFLIQLGNRYIQQAGKQGGIISKIFGLRSRSTDAHTAHEISDACNKMSASKTGALIVLPKANDLNDIAATGDKVDALVSSRLLQNLFFKNSPLHDGAVIISGERVVAARCTLPITDKTNIPANYGMRHKAAIGITEQTDAEVIVVSEETGRISYIKAGEITPITNVNELKLKLNDINNR